LHQKVIYTESDGVKIYVDVQKYEDIERNNYRKREICFNTVAKIRCINLNFFEYNYNNFNIENVDRDINYLDFWKENSYHPDSLFYQVINSEILSEKKKQFDPNNKLDLKHYLIVGYVGYVEIVASKYQYKYL